MATTIRSKVRKARQAQVAPKPQAAPGIPVLFVRTARKDDKPDAITVHGKKNDVVLGTFTVDIPTVKATSDAQHDAIETAMHDAFMSASGVHDALVTASGLVGYVVDNIRPSWSLVRGGNHPRAYVTFRKVNTGTSGAPDNEKQAERRERERNKLTSFAAFVLCELNEGMDHFEAEGIIRDTLPAIQARRKDIEARIADCEGVRDVLVTRLISAGRAEQPALYRTIADTDSQLASLKAMRDCLSVI